MSKFWRCLEGLRGLVAVPAVWRARLDGEFDAVRGAFLKVRPDATAMSIPCPHECGCAHEVIRHEDGSIVGVCRCESWSCDDIELKEEDLVLLELNWSRLGRAVAAAFRCEPREARLGVPGVVQVGSFGGVAVPVVLSIQTERRDFRSALTELVVRLRGGFILLAPTNQFVDAPTKELVANAKAGIFDLESYVSVLASGKLEATRDGGELFAALLPEKAEPLRESESLRVFRLFGELLAMGTKLKASPARVFDSMVFKKMTKAETAVACKCAASLITKRVALIENHFHMPIEKLRAFASDLKERQRTVKGDRYAKKKHGAVRDEPEQYDGGDKPSVREDDAGYLPEEKQVSD
jgi:hypothetical protein